MTVISGERGTGKSVLMLNMMLYQLGKFFDMEEQLIYSQEELIEKLKNSCEYSLIAVDEAITGIYKRDFAKKKQKNIVKILNTFRDKYYTIYLCIPNFFDLDSAIKSGDMIKFWIHCTERGKGVIFMREEGKFGFNVEKIFNYMRYNVVHKCPNFFGFIRWKKIPDWLYNDYKEIKARKRVIQDYADQTESKKSVKLIEKPVEISGFNLEKLKK